MESAREHCCEEVSMHSIGVGFEVPCNKPAEILVYHHRDRRSYRMCAGCADHNIRNRGGENRGPYIKINQEQDRHEN